MTERLRDENIELEPTSGSDEFTGFAILHYGKRIGTVALRTDGTPIASIRWNANLDHPFVIARAIRLAADHAFAELGISRVEVRLPINGSSDVKAASIGGLRREGIVRIPGNDPDHVLMARLADDPPAMSREGFIAILNAGLPTKRVISQGLLHDEQGRVLLCELTYKNEWDLPGGVVEVGEPPALGLVRELQEELGITVDVKGLLTVNWLPAWRGWDDACLFLNDLGTVPDSITEAMTLQTTEIRSVNWCDPQMVRTHAAAAAVELLDAVHSGGLPSYREAPKAAE